MTEKKLNVFERLMLMQILPKEGNYATLRLIRDFTSKLGISADEFKEFEVREIDATDEKGKPIKKATWNEKGNEEHAFELKEKEIDLIKEALEKLDKENKLDFQHFSLYEKFVKEEGT